jgi:hypothetical protein
VKSTSYDRLDMWLGWRERGNVYRVLVGKPLRQYPLGRWRMTREDYIKLGLWEYRL